MTIKYSLTGPDATARQIRDLRKTQSENMAALAKQSNGSGNDDPSKSLAYTDKEWSQRYTNHTSNAANPIAYDSTLDKDISITVPQSGIVLVTIMAWISISINNQSYYSQLGVRTGILPIKWYEGDKVPDLAKGQYGGCQITHEFYDYNRHISTVGASLANTTVFTGLTVGRKLTIRSRRFYWAWVGSPTSTNPIPSGSSYTISMSNILIQAKAL